jgi:hypothetical protein
VHAYSTNKPQHKNIKSNRKINRIGGGILVVKGEGHLYLLETALVLLLSERATLRQTSLSTSGGAQNLHQSHEFG